MSTHNIYFFQGEIRKISVFFSVEKKKAPYLELCLRHIVLLRKITHILK